MWLDFPLQKVFHRWQKCSIGCGICKAANVTAIISLSSVMAPISTFDPSWGWYLSREDLEAALLGEDGVQQVEVEVVVLPTWQLHLCRELKIPDSRYYFLFFPPSKGSSVENKQTDMFVRTYWMRHADIKTEHVHNKISLYYFFLPDTKEMRKQEERKGGEGVSLFMEVIVW